MIRKVDLDHYPDCPFQTDGGDSPDYCGWLHGRHGNYDQIKCYEKAPEECYLRKKGVIIIVAKDHGEEG